MVFPLESFVPANLWLPVNPWLTAVVWFPFKNCSSALVMPAVPVADETLKLESVPKNETTCVMLS